MKIYRRKFLSLMIMTAVLIVLTVLGFSSIRQRVQAESSHFNNASSGIAFAVREEAYRANNLGVALLEQFKYKEGAEAFESALKIDPRLALARINLSIALYNVPDSEASLREAQAALALNPNAPQPSYIIGLIAKSQTRPEDAIAAFQRVLKLDPFDVGANVNLGQVYAQQHRYAEAIVLFRTAIDAEPYNATAVYNLANALLRSGERAEGQRFLTRFQELRQSGASTIIGQNYLEQGRYAEAVASTGAEAELIDRSTPDITFTDATASMLSASVSNRANLSGNAQASGGSVWLFNRQYPAGLLSDATRREIAASLGGNVTLFDYDGDGALDMLWVAPFAQHLYHNEHGKFVDVTDRSGALALQTNGVGIGAVAGDFDNDGKADVFVLRADGRSALYHNDGDGKFSDVTSAAGIPVYKYLASSVAFVDVDHDGDLDIFIAGLADLSQPAQAGANKQVSFPEDFKGAPNMLLRNDGNGRFTDITAAAKVAGSLNHAVAVVPTDFDNRRDVDLLVVNYGAPPDLFSNQRDSSFRRVTQSVGLDVTGHFTCVAAGDINKDGYTDFFFGKADGSGVFALSDGRTHFTIKPAPAAMSAVSAAQFLDYDNDGLLDCITLGPNGLRVWRNVGDNSWSNVSEQAARNFSPTASSRKGADMAPRLLASSDVDGDGDTDLIMCDASGELRIARNDGGNHYRSVHVQLTGRVSNRNGIEAKIEVRAGSLIQKLETYEANPAPAPADTIFGLGPRESADAVRVLWPSGIVQAETQIVSAPESTSSDKSKRAMAANNSRVTTLRVTELDRKPSSCPYLYAWNGQRFEFITDFMGGGEMGYWEAPGRFNTPDPDEYVRIRGDQLKARDGHYELRVTNELEEALYVDRLQLVAVAHPRGVEIYPNEGMIDPPLPPAKIYATSNTQPPLSVIDDHGHDVRERITRLDRTYPDDFRLAHIRGYSDEHTLTLKLDEGASFHRRTLLLLTGWTDYAWSSDNVAAQQSGKEMKPPALQTKDRRGHWRTVIENIGVPIGRPQTVTVDLTGKFLSSSREVRIVTNMRIYWDQILVDTSDLPAPTQVTRLDPVIANLHWRGFSHEMTPDGREPFSYDYDQVSFLSPWKVMVGRYTREGDVLSLLEKSDDMFVVSRPGDEISLTFDATSLPSLPDGWTRTFLLYADGFSKEMDINSASPTRVAPLPFHGMSKYPYTLPEAYPLTEERRAYLERYNTRVVAQEVPSMELTILNIAASAQAQSLRTIEKQTFTERH